MTQSKFDTVAVLGAGTMGRGIAQVAATQGSRVALLDATLERAEVARDAIDGALQRLVEKGKLAEAEHQTILARIEATSERAVAVREADVVVEAAPEDLATKRAIFAALAKEAPP